ncbi:MAG: YbaK/EbsC family protein [bacterium]
MSVPKKVTGFLAKAGIRYEPLEHKTVYIAVDKAATLRLKQNVIAKTLIVSADKKLLMTVIPGNKILCKNKFKKVLNSYQKGKKEKAARSIDFISEATMKKNFPGIKLGAIPPFGLMWKMEVCIDSSLLKNRYIVVNGGNYESSIKITPSALKKTALSLMAGDISKAKK